MKNLSKKGFSLLEVMLAVAIMAVASSMIMYGFLASMNYANNTSIYARVAARNQRGGYYQMSHIINYNNRHDRYQLVGGADEVVKFEGVSGGTSYNIDLQVGVIKLDGNTAGSSNADVAHYNVINGAQGFDASFGDSIEGSTGTYYDPSATVADNRTTFFYTIAPTTFPSGTTLTDGHCPVCGEDYHLALYRRGTDTTNTLHWVCENWNDDSTYDHTAYRQQVLASWNTYSGT